MTEIMSVGGRPKPEGEVMNSDVHNSGTSRAHARAYAVCSDDSQTIRQTRVLKEPISARPRARTRGVRLLAKFRAWRIKTFGGDFDPVAVAVDEAPSDVIEAALSQLSERDKAFARAVLDGKGWSELGMPKATFYRRLKKVE